MNIYLSIFFILLIVFSIIDKRHKMLIFLLTLSVFADVFSINLGFVMHLSNVVGFAVLPLMVNFYSNNYFLTPIRKLNGVFRPLWLNFFYLLILGIVFGFLSPWTDISGHRTWTQQAPGRTVVTLFRYLSEFSVALYIAWAIYTDRVKLQFVMHVIGWISCASFCVAIVEYTSGFPLVRSLIQDQPKNIDRILGLNGEPKTFGRNAALAYAIILFYYLKVQKKKMLLFFIIINTITVILSLSASTFILFALFNLYILFNTKQLKILFLAAPLAFGGYWFISDNPVFEETKYKMEKAIFGSEDLDSSTGIMGMISRFDIFDHLAWVFLINNPNYILTGTGPNLISIPASRYVGDYIQYNTYAETGGIDSVPNVMFNNVLAASGITGIVLYIVFFVRLHKYAKRDKSGFSQNLVIITLIFNMVYFSIVLLFLTGIILGVLCNRIGQTRYLSKITSADIKGLRDSLN